MSDLKKIWNNRKQILEGITNSLIIKKEVEEVASKRQEICQSNVCTFYDAAGTSHKVIISGKPACSICGCNIHFLTHSMSSQCSLHEIDKEPLWPAILTQQEEDNLTYD